MKVVKFFTMLPLLFAGMVIITFYSCSKTTVPTVPSLTTKDVSIVTDTSAKVGGVVTNDGGASIIERGVCYNVSSNPSIYDDSIQSGSGTGTFDCTLTGLNQGTQYYYKAYAMNSAGVGYGDQKTFAISLGPCPGMPTITYEGQVYNTLQIFSQCWLKENLNIGTMINSYIGTLSGGGGQTDNDTIEKYCYNNDPVNCIKFGGLYEWNEMMQYTTQEGTQGICPPGWHLPTDEEWKVLEGEADSMYGIGDPEWDIAHDFRGYDAGTNLKTTNGWKAEGNGIDLFGFSGLPGGSVDGVGQSWHIGSFGSWWTSTKNYTDNSWHRRLNCLSPEVGRYSPNLQIGFSVRCLQD